MSEAPHSPARRVAVIECDHPIHHRKIAGSYQPRPEDPSTIVGLTDPEGTVHYAYESCLKDYPIERFYEQGAKLIRDRRCPECLGRMKAQRTEHTPGCVLIAVAMLYHDLAAG